MLYRRTLKLFTILLIACVVIVLSAYWGPSWLEPINSPFVIVPMLSIYIFDHLGIPGLLDHNGLCGWELCLPTILGWTILALFWLGVIWIVAWGVARLTARKSKK